MVQRAHRQALAQGRILSRRPSTCSRCGKRQPILRVVALDAGHATDHRHFDAGGVSRLCKVCAPRQESAAAALNQVMLAKLLGTEGVETVRPMPKRWKRAMGKGCEETDRVRLTPAGRREWDTIRRLVRNRAFYWHSSGLEDLALLRAAAQAAGARQAPAVSRAAQRAACARRAAARPRPCKCGCRTPLPVRLAMDPRVLYLNKKHRKLVEVRKRLGRRGRVTGTATA